MHRQRRVRPAAITEEAQQEQIFINTRLQKMGAQILAPITNSMNSSFD
jgi:hypothetical protein